MAEAKDHTLCECCIPCTVIGSWPKPDYVTMPDWFRTLDATGKRTDFKFAEANEFLRTCDRTKCEDQFIQATKDILAAQERLGIDVPTDGEVRRENYIYTLCRAIEGVNFDMATSRQVRGAYVQDCPTVTAKLDAFKEGAVDQFVQEWKSSQALSETPVKYTIPGPMTIAGTIADDFYQGDEEKMQFDLANLLSHLVDALVTAGCTHLQIDEPVFARKVAQSLKFGFAHLEILLGQVPAGVTRSVHMCCGYPDKLDETEYLKADPSAYFELAQAIDECEVIDEISLEDAHRRNEPSLFSHFKKTKVILGVVTSNKTSVESVEEIVEHMEQVMQHIAPEQIIAAPDCGLAMLPLHLVEAKMTNMKSACKVLGAKRLSRGPQRVQLPM